MNRPAAGHKPELRTAVLALLAALILCACSAAQKSGESARPALARIDGLHSSNSWYSDSLGGEYSVDGLLVRTELDDTGVIGIRVQVPESMGSTVLWHELSFVIRDDTSVKSGADKTWRAVLEPSESGLVAVGVTFTVEDGILRARTVERMAGSAVWETTENSSESPQPEPMGVDFQRSTELPPGDGYWLAIENDDAALVRGYAHDFRTTSEGENPTAYVTVADSFAGAKIYHTVRVTTDTALSEDDFVGRAGSEIRDIQLRLEDGELVITDVAQAYPAYEVEESGGGGVATIRYFVAPLVALVVVAGIAWAMSRGAGGRWRAALAVAVGAAAGVAGLTVYWRLSEALGLRESLSAVTWNLYPLMLVWFPYSVMSGYLFGRRSPRLVGYVTVGLIAALVANLVYWSL